jgi:hypothetical protein
LIVSNNMSPLRQDTLSNESLGKSMNSPGMPKKRGGKFERKTFTQNMNKIITAIDKGVSNQKRVL